MTRLAISMPAAALLSALAAHGAFAAPLPPDGNLELDGIGVDASPALDTTLQRERTSAFTIRGDGGAVLVNGQLLERVLRRGDGTLVFTYRLTNFSSANENAFVVQLRLNGFSGSVLDAEFVDDVTGQIGPSSVNRSSAPGDTVRFEFFPDLLLPFDDDVSDLLTLASGASQFAATGSATVTARVLDDDLGPPFTAVVDGVAVPGNGGGGAIFRNDFEAGG